jgi:nucleotide-binding universal stress UspA family protein
MADIRRITYATDFSPASLAAFPRALDLARVAGAELTILHVLASPVTLFIEGGYVPQEIWDQMDASQRAQAAQEMDRLVKQAVEAGVVATASCPVLTVRAEAAGGRS